LICAFEIHHPNSHQLTYPFLLLFRYRFADTGKSVFHETAVEIHRDYFWGVHSSPPTFSLKISEYLGGVHAITLKPYHAPRLGFVSGKYRAYHSAGEDNRTLFHRASSDIMKISV
jgi:hypothetical protein